MKVGEGGSCLKVGASGREAQRDVCLVGCAQGRGSTNPEAPGKSGLETHVTATECVARCCARKSGVGGISSEETSFTGVERSVTFCMS